MKTKFSKTLETDFFPVGDDLREIVADWIGYLRTEKLWGPEDPLFPATHVTLGENRQFAVAGLARDQWANAGPIRKIFREAFTRAGIPYANPHSFRNTLALLGETGHNYRCIESFNDSKATTHALVLEVLTKTGENLRNGTDRGCWLRPPG